VSVEDMWACEEKLKGCGWLASWCACSWANRELTSEFMTLPI